MLLTRPPLKPFLRKVSVRLACVKHTASVHPEPGSNSQKIQIVHDVFKVEFQLFSFNELDYNSNLKSKHISILSASNNKFLAWAQKLCKTHALVGSRRRVEGVEGTAFIGAPPSKAPRPSLAVKVRDPGERGGYRITNTSNWALRIFFPKDSKIINEAFFRSIFKCIEPYFSATYFDEVDICPLEFHIYMNKDDKDDLYTSILFLFRIKRVKLIGSNDAKIITAENLVKEGLTPLLMSVYNTHQNASSFDIKNIQNGPLKIFDNKECQRIFINEMKAEVKTNKKTTVSKKAVPEVAKEVVPEIEKEIDEGSSSIENNEQAEGHEDAEND